VITAVDTSVLIDVFGGDVSFGERSRRALRSCRAEGRLIACDVVWAEVAGLFLSPRDTEAAMSRLSIDFGATPVEAALKAGAAWRAHRSRGGRRTRRIADFLIGAHAVATADRLLTRDRGFYRSYFRRLRIVDPSA